MVTVTVERSFTVPLTPKYMTMRVGASLTLSEEDVDLDLSGEDSKDIPEALFDRATEAVLVQSKMDLTEILNAGVAADPKALQELINSL